MSSSPGSAGCTSANASSASTARMKASVTPTEILKLVRRPVSLAAMKRSMSGWSIRSTPIWAPRRAPADSTVRQEASNTSMYDTGPEAREAVPATLLPSGRIAEKS